MESEILLRIDGAVEEPLELSFAGMDAFPEADRVLDVSRFQPNRKGDGIALEAIFRRVRPRPEANYVTLHAGRDNFHVSIPLEPIRGEGVVVYRIGQDPLKPEQGGPVRLIIRDATACHTGELDECANVKYLDRIEVTVQKGRDTRPTDEAAHQALHHAQTNA
jgi:DMSO/TMAO reductase YedYZ molybdopterin-dependent catalytic subunit